jgi:serine/threonine protein kinase/tetratricopeptide (TPR) repeat protein
MSQSDNPSDSGPETHWRRVEELFLAALDRAPAQRQAFLTAACGPDNHLRQEVESLIEADESSSRFLEEAAPLEFVPNGEANDSPAIGRKLGAYQLAQKIGEGGMSTVFLAVRADDEYQTRVAIKIIRVGIETEVNLRRFRTERQILAGLDHPYISRLIDGGTTDEGLPYLVMEYVEGLPIDDFFQRHHLSMPKQVELFRRVCTAVEYAHRNLVVHRDLKPSNILIRSDGMPKLLDFGIAKMLNPELSGGSLTPTRFDTRMMTPEYASPEQLRGEPITTASDTYSLGVVLYELLTGSRPYELKGLTLTEVESVVCRQEPRRPSTVVLEREAADAPPPPSAVGGAHRLARFLSGDLDNILLKALRKEPERRYATVEQFSEDLRRFLVGLPVAARKDTFAYRTTKFIRRNRIGVTFATVVAVLLLSLVGVLAIQSTRVATALRQAEYEATKATAINDFLQETMGSAHPIEGLGREVSVLEVLDQAVDKIDVSFAREPEIEAAVRLTIGGTYRALGRYQEAEKLLRSSLAMRRQILGPEHPDVAESLKELALVSRAKGDYIQADQLLRQALEIHEKSVGSRSLEVAEDLYIQGALLRLSGRYQEAARALDASLATRQRLLGPTDPEIAVGLRELASLHWVTGDFAAAEDLYLRALSILRSAYPDGNPKTASVLNSLGIVTTARDDLAVAESYYLEALAMRRSLLGDGHPNTAETLSNLAGLEVRRGNFEKAEEMMQEALAIHQDLLGSDHPDAAGYFSNLARLFAAKGDNEEAKKLLRQALETKRRLLGDNHPDVAGYLSNLAGLLAREGDVEAAEQLLREALAIDRRAFGNEHPEIASRLENLAFLRWQQGDLEEADGLFRQSLEMKQNLLGPQHPDTIVTRQRLEEFERQPRDTQP